MSVQLGVLSAITNNIAKLSVKIDQLLFSPYQALEIGNHHQALVADRHLRLTPLVLVEVPPAQAVQVYFLLMQVGFYMLLLRL